MIRHNSANDSTFIGRLRGKRPDWTQKIGYFSGKTQKMGRILVRAQIAAMIEELRDCRSILEGLVSPGNEGSCPSRVVERIMTVLEILRQIDSQFKELRSPWL
jgi:hypothetical protein